jgi:hypothetical protein
VFTGSGSSTGLFAPATPGTVVEPVTLVRISQLPLASPVVPRKLTATHPGSASHSVKHALTSGTDARLRTVPISLVPQVTLKAFPYDESQSVALLATAPQVTAGHAGSDA